MLTISPPETEAYFGADSGLSPPAERIFKPGQPTKYDPCYCQQVIDFMAITGQSLTAFAAHIMASPDAVYSWCKTHAEFGEAVSIAKANRTSKLERGMFAARLPCQVTAHIFTLKNAAPLEYRDKFSLEMLQDPSAAQLSTPMLDAIGRTIEQVTVKRTVIRELQAPKTIDAAVVELNDAGESHEDAASDAAGDANDANGAQE